jgi:hypothetical protein
MVHVRIEDLEATGVADFFAPGNGSCGSTNCGCCKPPDQN